MRAMMGNKKNQHEKGNKGGIIIEFPIEELEALQAKNKEFLEIFIPGDLLMASAMRLLLTDNPVIGRIRYKAPLQEAAPTVEES